MLPDLWKLCRQHHASPSTALTSFLMSQGQCPWQLCARVATQPWVTGHQPCALSWDCCLCADRRSRSTFPRDCGKFLVQCPSTEADGQSCAVLSSSGTRAGAGQVPAEFTPPLAWSLPSAWPRLWPGCHTWMMFCSSSMKAILSHPEAPSCATSCGARPRASPNRTRL